MRKLSSSSQIEMVIKAFTTVANTTVTAKPKTSRQKQNTSPQNRKPHGKTKNLTAKTKYLTTKPKPSRQNQRPHGKNKYFTAKTKYLTAKANTHGKTKAILFLLWSIWFCREVFGFAVTYFVFAVRFLVSPWCFCFCREVFGFAVTVVGQKNVGSHPDLSRQTWEVACRTLFVCLFVFFLVCRIL